MLEAKLKKKKKQASSAKVLTTELRKKLSSTELLIKDTLAWQQKTKQEKDELESNVKEAVESADKRAIEAYKASDAFKEEVSEAIADSYFYGFEDCRIKADQLFSSLDSSNLIFDAGEEVEGEIPDSDGDGRSV